MTFQQSLFLFIVKKYHGYDHGYVSSGLIQSARFVVDMLNERGIAAKLVEAVDGNSIDALVDQNRPTRVVIEALWATPEKLAELQRLWPRVKWTVRIHSETPFLAQEGQAVGWIKQYFRQGIQVAFNSSVTVSDFEVVGKPVWLPNYYPMGAVRPKKLQGRFFNVGCFGAIRPLKNQLIQALAAVRYRGRIAKPLLFHMNGNRTEQYGDNNLKNIQALLGDQLVLHPWMKHGDFLRLVAEMDIVLAVSLSESFCITAADAVSLGVPLVGSKAIAWLPERSQAPVDNAAGIAEAMSRAGKVSAFFNREHLARYLKDSVRVWKKWSER